MSFCRGRDEAPDEVVVSRFGRSIGRKWLRSWRSPVALLTAVSVLLLMLMPMVAANFLGRLAAETGATQAHLHGAHQSPSHGPPAGHHDHGTCPFCAAHAGFAVPPPVPVAMPVEPVGTTTQAQPNTVDRPLPRHFMCRHRSRAPPRATAL